MESYDIANEEMEDKQRHEMLEKKKQNIACFVAFELIHNLIWQILIRNIES